MTQHSNPAVLSEDTQTAQAALDRAVREGDVPALTAALRGHSYPIKTQAAEALATVGTAEAAGPLREALQNHRVFVGGTETEMYHRRLVGALIGALARLTGEDFGPADPESDADVSRVLDQTDRWLGEK